MLSEWVTTIDVAEPLPMLADTLVVAPRLARAVAAVVPPVPPLAKAIAVPVHVPAVIVPTVVIESSPE